MSWGQSKSFALRGTVAMVSLLAVAGCTQDWDLDLRGTLGGLDTSDAARNASVANRPAPDARGVITYSDYQVAVARKGDTVNSVADRVGLSAATLAKLNGLATDATLREGEILSLPKGAVDGGTSPTALTPTVVDVSELAGGAVSENARLPSGSAGPAVPEPIRHRVEAGETAFTIARLYEVPVKSLAEWNGLGTSLAVREGQVLLIPVKLATEQPVPVISAPGTGTATPTPPSATRPQPRDVSIGAAAGGAASAAAAAAPKPVAPVVDLKPATSASAGPASVMTRPVPGSIIRSYKRGRNEGIDIGAAAGTAVKAALSGRVAAISKDTNGVNLLVLQHDDNMLTVYTNVSDIAVKKGATVKRGATIAKVAPGSPSFLHFEVRKGMESVDPEEFL